MEVKPIMARRIIDVCVVGLSSWEDKNIIKENEKKLKNLKKLVYSLIVI